MKKIFCFLCFCLLTGHAFAQVKFSVRLSPALALSRVSNASGNNNGGEHTRASGDGIGGAFAGGVALDAFLSDHIALNFGVNYIATQLKAMFSFSTNVEGVYFDGGSLTSIRNVQYIQVPVTIKAFTNEIATNTKLYFQLGPTLNIKIAEKASSSSQQKDDKNFISPIDAGVYLGTGVMYQLKNSNALFAGIYYNRNFINAYQNNSTFNYADVAKAHMDLLGLEVGFRF